MWYQLFKQISFVRGGGTDNALDFWSKGQQFESCWPRNFTIHISNWCFFVFSAIAFAPIIIRAANITISAGKKVDHTLFIILLSTAMCMPNFSYHCHLSSMAKAQKLNHHNLGQSKWLNRHFDWWSTNILETYDKIET